MWSDRQLTMLRAIGVRLWQPEPPEAGVAEPAAPPAAADASPAGAPAGAVVAAPPPATPRPVPHPAARAPDAALAGADAAGAGLAGAASRGGPPAAPRPKAPAVDATTASLALPSAAIAARGTGLDWDALRGAVAACDACALATSRTQTVFGVGHPNAHWMVVGEAPGEQEDLRGEPFVGPAGQLLDAMLRALALSREADGPPERRVYIANTLKCRPPRNRNPAPEELVRCEGFLVRQIELVQPRIILAMGRFAVQSLLRSDEPVGKLRGRVHRYQGVPLVVTYHPAYLLRNLPDKARAWEDLCLAAAVAERTGGG